MPSKQILQPIHVKRNGKAEGLIQGICLSGGNKVGSVQLEHVQFESGTKREILPVSFVLALIEITATQ